MPHAYQAKDFLPLPGGDQRLKWRAQPNLSFLYLNNRPWQGRLLRYKNNSFSLLGIIDVLRACLIHLGRADGTPLQAAMSAGR